MMIEDWESLGACRTGDPDALFVTGAEQKFAKRICSGCPVRHECLAEALDNRIEWGVWGGMTERERRALLRRHPTVSSWKRTFETALDATRAKLAASDQNETTNSVTTPEATPLPAEDPPRRQIAAGSLATGELVAAPAFTAEQQNPVV